MSTHESAVVSGSPIAEAWTSSRSARFPALACGVASMGVAMTITQVCRAGTAAIGWTGMVCAVLSFAGILASGRVMCTANVREISYRSGLGRWRRIAIDSIRQAEEHQVGPLAIVGVGVHRHRQQARHIVGAGHALHLELTTGEHVWLSTTGALPAKFLAGA